ncbi:MAG TPA: hypothetical protein VGJ41_16575 [Nocardioides sp.]
MAIPKAGAAALLPHDGPGADLRNDCDRSDAAYRALLLAWLSGQ